MKPTEKMLKELTPEQIWNEFANSNLKFNETLPNWSSVNGSGYFPADQLSEQPLATGDPD